MRSKLAQERLTDLRTTVLAFGSTSLISRTYETPVPLVIARTQEGTFCLQVMRRSVRRIPVFGSTSRLIVSTAMTCSQLYFYDSQNGGSRRNEMENYRILNPMSSGDVLPTITVYI